MLLWCAPEISVSDRDRGSTIVTSRSEDAPSIPCYVQVEKRIQVKEVEFWREGTTCKLKLRTSVVANNHRDLSHSSAFPCVAFIFCNL